MLHESPSSDVPHSMAPPRHDHTSGRRHCSRPTCSSPAVVTLTYEYNRAQVWLDALAPERNPHAYDICRRHADELSVPLGWHLTDRRAATIPERLAG